MYNQDSYKALLFDELEEYQEARSILENELDSDPTNIHLTNNLGILHFEIGNMELAEKFLHSSSKLGNLCALESLGDVYAKTGRLKEAVNLVENLIENETDSTQIGVYRRTIAIYYENAGDSKLAIESYKSSLEVDPNFDKALLFIAETLEKSGHEKEGREYRVKYGNNKKL